MKTILFIIQKEFKQIFRNKGMLPIIFIIPIIQILILSNAATYDIKKVNFGFIDKDKSAVSRDLISKFQATPYFNMIKEYKATKLGTDAIKKGKIDVLLEIPVNFDKDLIKEKKAEVSIQVNAINGAIAGVENSYVNQIIQKFNANIRAKLMPIASLNNGLKQVNVIPLFWFNQELNYKTFMVPGIIVLLITMISFFLSGMNIVREKEIGTLEQINVTPIKKYQFIIGKLFPFWVIGIFLLFVGMSIGRVAFHIPLVGNPFIILLFASIYILVFLGFGFLISNFTDTQQQAMFIAWFFVVIFILMSGLFTPIESMPLWAQKLTDFNPIRYFIEVIRMVMLKGSTLKDILPQLMRIVALAIVFNTLALISYKKTN
ncbi:MAG TPA: ABC transporter permease [Flavobacteriia bacterium]|nr:ABC transporter permease [Flavobacteriia bacterium]